MATARTIKTNIDAFIDCYARPKGHWYVGVAADPEGRLFIDHLVNRQTGAWIYWKADSAAMARQIERDYHDLGHDGDPGGRDADRVYVYAYIKTPATIERAERRRPLLASAAPMAKIRSA